VTIDSFLVGAWTRSRLVVDGARCTDRSHALWLQTTDWFADVRLPSRSRGPVACGPEAALTRPRAFAGTATWEPPVMTWHHQLDYLGDPISESMALNHEGGLLIEAGYLKWAGLIVPFRQEWRRISQPADEISAEGSKRRIQVTIGPRRILIVDDRPDGPLRASVLTLSGATWLTSGMLTEPP
jgi:hypothetical protein